MILIQFIILIYWFINAYINIYGAPERVPESLNIMPEPRQPEPLKEPEPVKIKEVEPAPEPCETEPAKEPPKIKPYTPPEPDPEREKLEKTAAGMLILCGCKFNTFHYCHKLSDEELMRIIVDYNLNK